MIIVSFSFVTKGLVQLSDLVSFVQLIWNDLASFSFVTKDFVQLIRSDLVSFSFVTKDLVQLSDLVSFSFVTKDLVQLICSDVIYLFIYHQGLCATHLKWFS